MRAYDGAMTQFCLALPSPLFGYSAKRASVSVWLVIRTCLCRTAVVLSWAGAGRTMCFCFGSRCRADTIVRSKAGCYCKCGVPPYPNLSRCLAPSSDQPCPHEYGVDPYGGRSQHQLAKFASSEARSAVFSRRLPPGSPGELSWPSPAQPGVHDACKSAPHYLVRM